MFIDGAATNSLGGTFGVPNIISGNTFAGVVIRGSTAQTNTIGPNFIGTRAGGVLPLGNGGDGVTVSEGAINNLIGNHTFLSQGNVIRFNVQVGVRIESATQNAILNNRISDNGLLGIDLEGDGVTLNDTADADAGANGRQNFPVLTSAADGVEGTLNSAPNTTFTITFFGNAACDASSHGEGATVLGSISVTTNGTGDATIPFFAAAAGQFVTATATSPTNNTSEFSACIRRRWAAPHVDLRCERLLGGFGQLERRHRAAQWRPGRNQSHEREPDRDNPVRRRRRSRASRARNRSSIPAVTSRSTARLCSAAGSRCREASSVASAIWRSEAFQFGPEDPLLAPVA